MTTQNTTLTDRRHVRSYLSRPCALGLAMLFLSVACGDKAKAPEKAVEAAPETAPETLNAATELPTTPNVAPVDHHGIPWFEDAPEDAMAAARGQNKPLVVDLWAPWCHTCLSMKSYVLTDRALPGLKDDFIFLALNTEQPKNAAFVQQIPLQAWPTFYILDAKDAAPTVRGRWVGAASPKQFAQFLRDGKHAFESARSGDLDPTSPLALLIDGDRLFAEGKHAAASEKFAAALKAAPKDWPRRPETLLAHVSLLAKTQQFEACVDYGATHADETGDAATASDFAYYVAACADEFGRETEKSKAALQLMAKRVQGLCFSEAGELSPDDRGDACGNLAELHAALGDARLEKAARERQLTVLETAAEGLPDDVAMTYDWLRVSTLMSLGRAAEILPLLKAREKAVPDSYNAAYYQARIYLQLERFKDGIAAIERALKLGYGPRKASMYGIKASLFEGAGNISEAKAAVQAQLDVYDSLPEAQVRPGAVDAAKAKLAELQTK